jgi:hypothetical protein
MPTYRIEQYEIHCQAYNVTGDTEAEAVSKLFLGEGDPIDNSLEFINIADDHGLPIDENEDLADQLLSRGTIHSGDLVIPSIRSIERIDERTDLDCKQ